MGSYRVLMGGRVKLRSGKNKKDVADMLGFGDHPNMFRITKVKSKSILKMMKRGARSHEL